MTASSGPTGWRFLAGVAAGLGLAVLVWLLLIAGQLGQSTAGNRWISEAYAHKLALAERITEPKLLVVAGSNALFGLDSARLERALGRPVLNLGINAGVQSPFIVAYARRAIRPGDWVLLPLEYPLYHDRQRIGYALLDYWLSHPSLRSVGLLPAELLQLLWQTPLARVWEGYRGLPAGFAVHGLYGVHNMNAYGDQIDTGRSLQQQWMREMVEQSDVARYGALATPRHANWRQWRALAEEVKAAGGCAIFIPPVMLERAAYRQGDEAAYYRDLPEQARAQGLRFLGEPFDFMYPLDHFFDTSFHLTAEARTAHTDRVVRLVRPAHFDCS